MYIPFLNACLAFVGRLILHKTHPYPCTHHTHTRTQTAWAQPTALPTEQPTGAPTSYPTPKCPQHDPDPPECRQTVAMLGCTSVTRAACPAYCNTCTEAPTASPTKAPTTLAPTADPTAAPTSAPTATPTATPTRIPTAAPTHAPSAAPTSYPTPTCPYGGPDPSECRQTVAFLGCTSVTRFVLITQSEFSSLL